MVGKILESIARRGAKLAVLIDPDKHNAESILELIVGIKQAKVDLVLVGGSLLMNGNFEKVIEVLKRELQIPIVLFPGSSYQVSGQADGLLMLSLISGRNPEYLIGQHVAAAAMIRAANLEIIPTGYMLIDGGRMSTTAYMTQTMPIPRNKTDIAVATAMAGEMLGMKAIYLEAGSGAELPVSMGMVQAVKANVKVPLIVGGGIRTPSQVSELVSAGADLIVVGNVLETHPDLLRLLSDAVHQVV